MVGLFLRLLGDMVCEAACDGALVAAESGCFIVRKKVLLPFISYMVWRF